MRLSPRELREKAATEFTEDEWNVVLKMGKRGYSDAEAFALGFLVPMKELPRVTTISARRRALARYSLGFADDV